MSKRGLEVDYTEDEQPPSKKQCVGHVIDHECKLCAGSKAIAMLSIDSWAHVQWNYDEAIKAMFALEPAERAKLVAFKLLYQQGDLECTCWDDEDSDECDAHNCPFCFNCGGLGCRYCSGETCEICELCGGDREDDKDCDCSTDAALRQQLTDDWIVEWKQEKTRRINDIDKGKVFPIWREPELGHSPGLRRGYEYVLHRFWVPYVLPEHAMVINDELPSTQCDFCGCGTVTNALFYDVSCVKATALLSTLEESLTSFPTVLLKMIATHYREEKACCDACAWKHLLHGYIQEIRLKSHLEYDGLSQHFLEFPDYCEYRMHARRASDDLKKTFGPNDKRSRL